MSSNGPLSESSVYLADEDDVSPGELTYLEQCLRDLRAARRIYHHIPLADLNNGEEDNQSVLEYEEHLNRLDDSNKTSSARAKITVRNPPIASQQLLPSVRYEGRLIRPGSVVEVAERCPEEFQVCSECSPSLPGSFPMLYILHYTSI